MGEQHRLGNRERREAAIGIEQTPISFGQKIPLRRFYLVTLRHNESLSRGLQIAETQPWTFGKYSRPRYVRFGRRIMPRGSLEYFGIVSACAENAHVVRGTSIGQRSVAMSSASTSSSAFSTYMRMERTRSRPRFIYMPPLQSNVVGAAGFEPARACAHQPLKLARLPVPPRPDGTRSRNRTPIFGFENRRSSIKRTWWV